MGFSLGGSLKSAFKGAVLGPLGSVNTGLLGGAGITGGQIFGGDARNEAARIAAEAQQKAIDEQRRQFDLSRGDILPFLQGGLQAQSQLQDIFSGKTNATNDPLMQQQLALAGKQAGRFASAGGSLGTGAYNKDLLRGTANVFNNRINQLLALRSGGQSAAGTLGSLGQATAANVGQGLQNLGNIQAAPYLGKANTIDNLLQTALGAGIGGLMGGM